MLVDTMVPGTGLDRWSAAAVVSWIMSWAFICCVSAGPSLAWVALFGREFHGGAIVAGIGVYFVAYLALTSTREFATFARKWSIRRTLLIGYLTRIVVSAVFPIGMALDLVAGLFSMNFVGGNVMAAHSFQQTFLITLVQGAVLHLVLGIYMVLAFGLVRAFGQPPADVPRGRAFEVILHPRAEHPASAQ
jgi:hypothetical protein